MGVARGKIDLPQIGDSVDLFAELPIKIQLHPATDLEALGRVFSLPISAPTASLSIVKTTTSRS
jgi:hypothetical protein